MKTKQPRKYGPLAVKLIPNEQSIEDAIDENSIPESDPAILAEVRAGLAVLSTSLRGGMAAFERRLLQVD